MMNKFSFPLRAFLLSLLCVCLASCGKNEFRMEFRLPADVNATYRIAYYASSKKQEMQIESAVAVTQGKGEIMGVTHNPAVVSLYYGSSFLPSAVFYAERGDDVILSGESADPLEWTISGNKVNDRLTGWRLKNRTLLRNAASASLPSSSRSRSGVRDDSDAAAKKLNAAVEKYIDANPDDIAGGILFYSYFDANADPVAFARIDRRLQENGMAERLPGLTSRQDILSDSRGIAGEKTKKVQDMEVQSYWRNLDTLRFAGSPAPVLVYFWNSSDPGHGAIVDTLRNLVKWRGDSASMRIADVALSSDSAAWAYSVKRDSLRLTLRAISPRGLADPDVMRLGVRSTPWFVVTASGGKLLYSGPSSAEALRMFGSRKKK